VTIGGSTLLNEVGCNGDWIEKCLAHEYGRSSRSAYNKTGDAEPRRRVVDNCTTNKRRNQAGSSFED
jgi:hypothetical protein